MFFLLLLLTGACSLIFEDEINEEELLVIMPHDGTESVNQDQLFWWEFVPGALDYNLQIVVGSFTEPEVFVADTMLSGNKFNVTLQPGQYEWRICALNNYSSTAYFYSTLSITDTTGVYEE